MTLGAALWLVLEARVVTLGEAERTAEAHQPQLTQAAANTEAAAARVEQAFAPFLPEVKATGIVERATGNRYSKPTRPLAPAVLHATPTSTHLWGDYEFGLGVTETLWDWGQTLHRWRAAQARVSAQAETEQLTRLQIVLAVRAAYFAAWAQKAMVAVARDTLANQERHFAQIAGFVEVGTRPAIDLAQARADRANAKVLLIGADAGYVSAKAALNQAMGVPGALDYDVADEIFGAVPGEDGPGDALVAEAIQTRPDLASLRHLVQAQRLTATAIKGAYLPTLTLNGLANDRGTDLEELRWNVGGWLALTWPLFQGFLTRGQVREAEALGKAFAAQGDTLALQVWASVQQAQLAVRAAKEGLVAADEAASAAAERLRLAEGRYETGAGNAIELGDAQLGATAASAQKVQATYNLAAARAQLMEALGQR